MASGRTINTLTDKPDVYTDPDGECSWSSPEESYEYDDNMGEVIEFQTLYKGPSVFAVQIGKNWDPENEEYDDTEIKAFHSREEATTFANEWSCKDDILRAEAEENYERQQEADERQRHLAWLHDHPDNGGEFQTVSLDW